MPRYAVYGLVDPRDDTVFYIGQSRSLKRRRRAHQTDCVSSAYPRCRAILKAGLKVGCAIFAEFDDKLAALRLERMLILNLPGLTNEASCAIHLSLVRFPIGKMDHLLLMQNNVAHPFLGD